jgi:hypothetical protein
MVYDAYQCVKTDAALVDILCFAATGIAGEKGECVRIYADGIFSHSKIAFC